MKRKGNGRRREGGGRRREGEGKKKGRKREEEGKKKGRRREEGKEKGSAATLSFYVENPFSTKQACSARLRSLEYKKG